MFVGTFSRRKSSTVKLSVSKSSRHRRNLRYLQTKVEELFEESCRQKRFPRLDRLRKASIDCTK